MSVEIPVSDAEKRILHLILEGYACPDIRKNAHLSLLGYMKIEPSKEMDYYLYTTFLLPEIAAKTDAIKEWVKSVKTQKTKTPNKADMIRLTRVEQTVKTKRHAIFEFLLLDTCKTWTDTKLPIHLYTLLELKKSSIPHLNPYVASYVDLVIRDAGPTSGDRIRDVFFDAVAVIERNPLLIEYQDETLYGHQRDLFRTLSKTSVAAKASVANACPKLVLYTAPTGTGKTLSPIGLSQHYRVIFVCVARHVGLALAKSAISVGKRVAFAFGAETSSDIRLHYFAAADYTIHRKSGGIGKVDNSNGIKVEIMICDVASYPVAMCYMKAFHPLDQMILYWDEPTISLDAESHELHGLIQNVWTKNQVPNVVLSCATLPKKDELEPLIHSFQSKFAEDSDPEVHVIDSYDCKKSITLLNKEGQIVLPHLLFASYRDLMECVEHCDRNRSLLRYFDVAEIVRFLQYVRVDVATVFKHVSEITLLSIKLYYLDTLRNLDADEWPHIHTHMRTTLSPRFSLEKVASAKDIRKIQSMTTSGSSNSLLHTSQGHSLIRTQSVSTFGPNSSAPSLGKSSSSLGKGTPSLGKGTPSLGKGILLTTTDAHTLTDGPTLYLAEDVDKIGKFYIQQSNIPEQVFRAIQEKIERNNAITKQIAALEKEAEDKAGKPATEDSKKAEKEPTSKEMQRLLERVANLRENLYTVHLSPAYIPNTKAHQDIWIPAEYQHVKNAFVAHVDEEDVREIMGLSVDNQKKLLLILGIGVFSLDIDKAYMEIMKRLAYNQRLFLIIASSDYIYGTNYQFCHGFIGKDLANMTQQKTIQAIGRVGRNNIQQEYTVRFRDDTVIERLFRKVERNLEAENMCRLFCEEE